MWSLLAGETMSWLFPEQPKGADGGAVESCLSKPKIAAWRTKIRGRVRCFRFGRKRERRQFAPRAKGAVPVSRAHLYKRPRSWERGFQPGRVHSKFPHSTPNERRQGACFETEVDGRRPTPEESAIFAAGSNWCLSLVFACGKGYITPASLTHHHHRCCLPSEPHCSTLSRIDTYHHALDHRRHHTPRHTYPHPNK